MSNRYEYTVVHLKDGPVKTIEAEWGEQLNAVSGHGWRLQQIVRYGASGWSLAIFERESPRG